MDHLPFNTMTAIDERGEPFEVPAGVYGLRTGCRIFFHLFSNLTITGRENFPEPPFIVIANHMSYFDVPLLAAAFMFHVPAFAARKYVGTPMQLPFNLGSPVWIDQNSPDRKALVNALKILKAGIPFGIAVEGRRSKTATLIQGQDGAVFVASRAQVPIVPAGIVGTDLLFKKVRPKVRVAFGKPFRLPDKRLKGEELSYYTDQMMCAIAALLPERYHGYYAGHPMIQEMAARVY